MKFVFKRKGWITRFIMRYVRFGYLESVRVGNDYDTFLTFHFTFREVSE